VLPLPSRDGLNGDHRGWSPSAPLEGPPCAICDSCRDPWPGFYTPPQARPHGRRRELHPAAAHLLHRQVDHSGPTTPNRGAAGQGHHNHVGTEPVVHLLRRGVGVGETGMARRVSVAAIALVGGRRRGHSRAGIGLTDVERYAQVKDTSPAPWRPLRPRTGGHVGIRGRGAVPVIGARSPSGHGCINGGCSQLASPRLQRCEHHDRRGGQQNGPADGNQHPSNQEQWGFVQNQLGVAVAGFWASLRLLCRRGGVWGRASG